jgi:hypothetical protein
MHNGALTHDSDAIGHGHDFAQFVRHENHGFSFVAQPAQHGKQCVGFLRRKDRRRLVEDQDIRPVIERLQNFHPLLQPDRQIGDHRVEWHAESVILRQFLQRPPRLPHSPREMNAAFDAKHDVFEHREILHQHEMLVHHPDAGGDRGVRRVDVDAFSPHQNLAGVGTMKTVDDVHQRRLARAVFADQSVDASGRDGKIDGAIRVHGAESFFDAAQFDGRRSHVRRLSHSEIRFDQTEKTRKATPSAVRGCVFSWPCAIYCALYSETLILPRMMSALA